MEKEQKLAKSNELRTNLEGVPAVVLLQFDGLTVAEVNDLRGQFREAGCTYKVHKNSTIRYAVKDTDLEPIVPFLKGATGLAFNADDPGAPARVAREFAKSHEKLKLKGGVMEGQALDASGVERLADMPGPRELKAQLLSLLNTPATQFVRVLNAPAQNLLNVINAKKDEDAA
ncbi:MAG: 50S ribosomal protein L10 [Myxococcales bacterium FL481]|nr:MAG: 50S ribosomal protein L10 [Myxococcales bacterium FL481]